MGTQWTDNRELLQDMHGYAYVTNFKQYFFTNYYSIQLEYLETVIIFLFE